jgi:ribosomal protein L31
MKKDIHPEYRMVAFKDIASGTMFLTRSHRRNQQDGKARRRQRIPAV